jgi:chromosome segregation ATPase
LKRRLIAGFCFCFAHVQRDEFLLSLEEVNREHDEVNAQLHEVQARAELDFREIERVEEECVALTAQIAHCNKLNQAKREESSALKNKANDLKDELATATWALEEVEAEEGRLRGQVVSSPERRQKELHSKRDHLDRERDECRELEEQLQNIKTMCHHVEVATQAMENEVATIESVSSEAQKYAAAAKRLEATTQEVKENQKMVDDEKEQLALCERDLNRTEEQLSNLHKQCKMKMEAAQEALELTKSRLGQVEKDRRDCIQQVELGAARIREIETQIEQERLKTQQEIDTMIAEYRETEESVLARIDKRIEKISVAHNNDI